LELLFFKDNLPHFDLVSLAGFVVVCCLVLKTKRTETLGIVDGFATLHHLNGIETLLSNIFELISSVPGTLGLSLKVFAIGYSLDSYSWKEADFSLQGTTGLRKFGLSGLGGS
jgi:hypothetical protein